MTELPEGPARNPDHELDFRSCTAGTLVEDRFSCSIADGSFAATGTRSKAGPCVTASAENGALCTSQGITLDGIDDYINIRPWQWGGAASFELLVKTGNIAASFARILDFGNGGHGDGSFSIGDVHGTGTFQWLVGAGESKKFLKVRDFWVPDTWHHIVATVHGNKFFIFKDGELVGHTTSGIEPSNAMRAATGSAGQRGREVVLSTVPSRTSVPGTASLLEQ